MTITLTSLSPGEWMPSDKRIRYGAVTSDDVGVLTQILTELVADFERIQSTMVEDKIDGINVDGIQTFGKAAHSLHQMVGQLEMGVARYRADQAQEKLDGVSRDK